MKKVFIDGSSGTAGLRARDRLVLRKDIELICLPENKRKDIGERQKAYNQADIVIMCLPDYAAKESVCLLDHSHASVIDASSAHRIDAGWTYGFPELSGQREKIRSSRFISNPGCQASGFISLVAPLIEKRDYPKGYPSFMFFDYRLFKWRQPANC